MTRVIKQHTVVQDGGVIEIHSPELPTGAEAEVTVKVRTNGTQPRKLTQFMGRGSGLFKNADEVDSYIRELRDEWQR